jgi:zinc transporter ZupT
MAADYHASILTAAGRQDDTRYHYTQRAHLLTVVLVSAGAFLSALAGGVLALRAAHHIGLIIAVGAGIRIGAAYFDLIPESVEHLGDSLDSAMLFTAVGFLAFYALEKVTLLHVGHETATELDHEDSAHRHVGLIGASGMSLHSFLDGVALAAGLAVGGGIGLVIGAVVIVHRFSDGVGIVSLLLASRMPRNLAYRWVALVALAPVAGVLTALVLPVPDGVLGGMLAVFAGFFLYIGAAELLPEAHRNDRSMWVVGATLAGVAAIYLFSVWAGAIGGHS